MNPKWIEVTYDDCKHLIRIDSIHSWCKSELYDKRARIYQRSDNHGTVDYCGLLIDETPAQLEAMLNYARIYNKPVTRWDDAVLMQQFEQEKYLASINTLARILGLPHVTKVDTP